MKRFLVFLIAIIAITMSTCVPAHATTHGVVTFTRDANVSFSDQYAGMIVSFTGSVDSVVVDTSAVFTFAGYQGESWYVNPIQYSKVLTSSSGKPYVTIIIQGQIDGNWVSVDTIGIPKDSIETVQRSTTDFNNLKCSQYRAIISGTQNAAGTFNNPDDSTFSLYFFLPRKDN